MRYLAIGHICQDVVPEGRILGGTATYASLTARALGWQTTALTRIAPQVDLSRLGAVACLRLPGERTTTFENIYTLDGRVQFLHDVAEPITKADTAGLRLQADVVHLAPVANEVDPDLADAFDGALIGATPQGWMRRWDSSGRVRRGEWLQAEVVLNRADAIVLSLEDVGGDWALIRRWADAARVLVVTLGRDGCTVYTHGERPQPIPTLPVEEVDPTGAGDVFAAAFFVRLRESGDPIGAARFANCIAARSVTRFGLDGAPTRQEVTGC
jgi:sugar/nucleoside kinase (ribokinase family)